MRRVAIAGIGVTPRTDEYIRGADGRSWKDYVVEAAYEAIGDVSRGLGPRDLQYAVVSYHGEASVEAGGIGPVVSDILGLHPMGVTTLSANCVGAGVGLHDAFGLVASGRYDRVLVLGFDKQWELLSFADKRSIGGDVDYDFNLGYDHPVLQAMLQAYAYKKWGIRNVLKAMSSYRMQSLWFASRNPKAARWRRKLPQVTLEQLFALVDQIGDDEVIPPEFWRLLPGNINVEGAAAMILVPGDDVNAYTDRPVYVDAIAYASNSHLLSKQMYYPAPGIEQYDMCDFAAVHVATDAAYKMAGIGPKDVDFAELFESHITSLLPTLAATGVPEEGKLCDFIIAGETGFGGRLPTGTDGGRGGFGITSGSNFADGIAEAVIQIRGDAGARQIGKADRGVVTGMQGEMASSAVAILSGR